MEIPTAQARKELADLVNRVAYGKERVVLTRHGRAVAALVPLEDLTLVEQVRAKLRQRTAEKALEDAEAGRVVDWDALREEI